jgi:hypothetical protein
MRPEEQFTDDSGQPRHRKFELFYFEKVGTRYQLRFTRLAVLLIIGLTVVSIVSILVIFLISSQQMASESVNVNVSVPTRTVAPSDKPILKPPPPAPRLPKVAQPVYRTPTPSSTPPPAKNSNGQTIPKQTPQSSPSESPP